MSNSPATTHSTTLRPWWQDVVCYQVWPMSFKDSNSDGIGDIPGVISKLDYLKQLGVDVLWISPTYKSPLKDFGYDVSDWQDVSPVFGTMADMDQLITEVHARGMKILLDLVITHTSNQHPWFLESRSSRQNPKRDWYIWKNSRKGHKIRNHLTQTEDLVEEPTNYRACFGGSAWYYGEERKQWYMHLFLLEEPDLNWENPETRKAIFDTAIGFWLDKGVDGFRIDTVNRLSKDPSYKDAPIKLKGNLQPATQYYINGPKSHDYLREMRAYMDNHPSVKGSGRDLMLVGELPRTSPEEVFNYTHPASKELNMVFDFDMVNLSGHDDPDETPAHMVKNLCDGHHSFTLPLFKETLKKVQDIITNGGWGTVFMENHDQCRSIARYATPDKKYYVPAAKLLCLLQTTLSGTQFVYQGQEIGMLDVPEHWDIQDFRDPGARLYILDEEKKGGAKARESARVGNVKFGRDNGRTPMQWTPGPNAGFSTVEEGKTWIGVNGNCKKGINVRDQQEDKGSIWHFWRRQIIFRKEYKEMLMHGAFEILDYANEKTFTYLKTSAEGDRCVVCLNFSNEEQPLYMPKSVLKGQLPVFVNGNQRIPVSSYVPLQAWEGRMYFLEQGPAQFD